MVLIIFRNLYLYSAKTKVADLFIIFVIIATIGSYFLKTIIKYILLPI